MSEVVCFMFCTRCGANNDNNAYRCVSCGEVLQTLGGPTPPVLKVPNYLVQAIGVTVLCCLPFGIPAIVFAAQVNGKLQAGDVQGAMDCSRKARMWCWISFSLGLTATMLYVLLMAISAFASK